VVGRTLSATFVDADHDADPYIVSTSRFYAASDEGFIG
jgi:hypothetical protein